jgi:tetratricopeptide (TPR) repeat protein
VKSLPNLARTLARVIGISGQGLTAHVTETPDTLTKLGGYPWDPPDGFVKAEELDSLSRKSPLGLVMYISNRENVNDGGMLIEAIDDTIKIAPSHPLLLGQLGKYGLTGYPALESLQKSVEKLQKRYPNNFLANLAFAAIETGRGDFGKGRPRLERAVRCAMHSPSSWLMLSDNYREQAGAIRKGVFASEMTEGQSQVTSSLYEMELLCALRAVDCDPKHPAAWFSLSGAAAFFGDRELADEAMTNLLKVEQANPLPDRASIYEWGLQLYHPKWQDNPVKAKALVDRAVSQAQSAGRAWTGLQRAEVAVRAALLGHGEAAAKIASDPESKGKLSEYLDIHRDEMVDPNVRVPGIN